MDIYKLGVGKKYFQCSFETFEGDNAKALIMNAIKPAPPPWIYIFGVTGCGKTHLAIAMIRHLLESGRITMAKDEIIFQNVAQMLFDIRHTYDVNKFGDREWDHINRYNNARLLVFDDLGAERQNDWALDILYRIVYHRDKEGLVTWTTSNFSPTQTEKMHGAPTASRLCSGAVIEIKMPDHRKLKNQANTR